MIINLTKRGLLILFIFLVAASTGCGRVEKKPAENNEVTITLGAYTVPREVYRQEIIPAFQEMWKKKTGREVRFQESYMASGAQSRAIAAGFEADIAALSLEQDITRLANLGLISHNWEKRKYGGFVTRSIGVLAFRPGNPFEIKDWTDLISKDVEILYPSPRTSGGAMWIINTLYGAGLKTSEKQGKQDPDFAREFLKQIQARVKVMDKSGRESVATFERGFGDILLTYENEALLRQKQGKDFPFLIPGATIQIENPVALVDKYVDKHGNREVVEAFLDFLLTRESQRIFARFGFRPVDPEVLVEFTGKFPAPGQLFDIGYLGGWERVMKDIFDDRGLWSQVIRELAEEK